MGDNGVVVVEGVGEEKRRRRSGGEEVPSSDLIRLIVETPMIQALLLSFIIFFIIYIQTNDNQRQ